MQVAKSLIVMGRKYFVKFTWIPTYSFCLVWRLSTCIIGPKWMLLVGIFRESIHQICVIIHSPVEFANSSPEGIRK